MADRGIGVVEAVTLLDDFGFFKGLSRSATSRSTATCFEWGLLDTAEADDILVGGSITGEAKVPAEACFELDGVFGYAPMTAAIAFQALRSIWRVCATGSCDSIQ